MHFLKCRMIAQKAAFQIKTLFPFLLFSDYETEFNYAFPFKMHIEVLFAVVEHNQVHLLIHT